VLEALLKRVDGLEKRLHTEGKSDDPDDETQPSPLLEAIADSKPTTTFQPPSQSQPHLEIAPNAMNAANQLISPIEPRCL
jgi:hypothetical protein